MQTPVETGTVQGNHCVLTVNKDFFCVFVNFCLPIFGVSGFNYSWQGKDTFFFYFFFWLAGLLTASVAGRMLVFLLSLCVVNTKRLFNVMLFANGQITYVKPFY